MILLLVILGYVMLSQVALMISVLCLLRKMYFQDHWVTFHDLKVIGINVIPILNIIWWVWVAKKFWEHLRGRTV